MSHDPLCPYFPEQQGFGGIGSGVQSTQPYIPSVPCQCDLIARVREDEATRAHRMSDAYRTALRDAVEAIKALPSITDAYPTSSPAGGEGLSIVTRTWLCNRDSAVAAIESLGGER